MNPGFACATLNRFFPVYTVRVARHCLWAGSFALSLFAQDSKGVKTPDATVVFAKALAQVRYTHPSDEAYRARWPKISKKGLGHFSQLPPERDLKSELHQFFSAHAPSIQFLPIETTPVCPSVPAGTQFLVRYTPTWLKNRKREYARFGERPPKGWDDPQGNRGKVLGPTVQMLCPTVCFANQAYQTLPRAPKCHRSLESTQKTSPCETTQELLLSAWGILWLFHPATQHMDWDQQLLTALSECSQKPFLEQFQHMIAPLQDKSLNCQRGNPRRSSNVTCWPLSDAFTLQWKPVN